ncbi:hypothetical protein SAMD00023353_2300270 [Rosellinia necatrix]|uniref:Uncharacterized protein n=1 Tax=Rosellinia necatrix TaxID=77044 RepID=A0A1S8A7S9_ROSNE|nr:hypothetical protein SAMD00023353_2300270 [Rosellinia necatrix]
MSPGLLIDSSSGSDTSDDGSDRRRRTRRHLRAGVEGSRRGQFVDPPIGGGGHAGQRFNNRGGTSRRNGGRA